ncbi:tetratricopeptide repeat protein [Kitasatospora sp. NPDC058115]|uniref:tetratricopeptide repeat protein n=1 Tax=Kitasatospora sp. NPDC058115 TaxID=3346347 RepID=UPI0036D8AF80
MAQARRRLSRAEAVRQRTGAQFIGRRAQLALFVDNLARDPDPDSGPDPADFLFHVRGVGGVGKSTLLAQWREAARRAGALTALVDETDVHGVETALTALARQLAEQAGPLREFDKAVEQYRRSLQAAADREPEQPPGGEGASLPTRMAAQAALGAASVLPGAGVVAAMANPDAVAQGAERLIAGVRQRRRGGDVEESALSRAFVAELARLCDRDRDRRQGRRPWVVLFLDTWELTGRYLDGWLRETLDDAFGPLPLEVVFVLAGRDELAEREWAPWRPVLVDVPLEVFTEQEARDLMAARGVTDPLVVDAVLRMSMRLPLLVALLAAADPGAVEEVADVGADMVDQAVVRFLQWIPEQERRETVLAAALPLQLNQDLFACAVPDAEPAAWAWLSAQPFVTGRGDFLQYHAVVRTSMVRRRRIHTPREWTAAHTRLAEHHAAARTAVEQYLPAARRGADPRWRRPLLNELYHLLCADPLAHLAVALEHTARTAGDAPDTLAPWAEMLSQAAQDSDDAELVRWARRIHTAAGGEQPVLETLDALAGPGLPTRVRAWALTHRGYQYFVEDRDDDALADLDQAVAIAPDLPQALAYRGRVLNWHGHHERALADFTAALALDPEYAWALSRRGEARQLAGLAEEAMADFTAALALDPDDAWALGSRGQAHRLAGRLEEAVADLTAAILLDPEYAWALTQRGEAFRMAGRPAEAVADFTAALALDPGDAWALSSRGQAHRQTGRLDEAVADLTAALTLGPDNAWALAERGEAHRLAGRPEEAVADFTAAVALNPENAWALGSRAQAHRQAGRFDEAVADFTAALALNPEYAWAVGERGEAHRQAGRLDEAVADFTAALALDPEYAWALAERGEAHRQAGRLDEAVADLSAALLLDPVDVWALRARGQAHRQAGRLDDAIADLTAVLAIDPEYAWALALRGEAHRLAGDLEEAVADLSAALVLEPDDAWALGSRGQARRQAGEVEAAVADLTAALAQNPDYAWALAERGQAHRQAGRTAQAVADLEAVLARDPADVAVRCALAAAYRHDGRFADAREVLEGLAPEVAASSTVLVEVAVLRLLTEGPAAAAEAWEAFLECPYEDPRDLFEPGVRKLLYGLVAGEGGPQELVRAFLAVPGARAARADVCLYLGELARAAAPVGARAAEALRFLE